MLPIYSTILSLHEEPKDMYKVCSLFMNILSSKSFWKERHEREGLPFVDGGEKLSPLRTYYLTREFAKKEMVLCCHLSELPFFPSFAQGEEYYPRAIKFRREKVPESINEMLLDKCIYHYSKGYEGWGVDYDYNMRKASNDKAIEFFETSLGVADPKHPSLDVNVKLYRLEDCAQMYGLYCFYLYLDLPKEKSRVEVSLEKTTIDMEEALCFYLQVKAQ
nr:hypothetical protein Cduv_124 [Cedratvirus duvanny]